MKENVKYYVSENLEPAELAICIASKYVKDGKSVCILYKESRYTNYYIYGDNNMKNIWNNIQLVNCMNFTELQTAILSLTNNLYDCVIIDTYFDYFTQDKPMEIFSSFTKLCFILETISLSLENLYILDKFTILTISVQASEFQDLILSKLLKIYKISRRDKHVTCEEILYMYNKSNYVLELKNNNVLNTDISKLTNEILAFQIEFRSED